MKLGNSHARRVLSTNPVVVITTINSQKEANALTVTWCTPVSLQPPLLMAAIGEEMHSLQNLRETGKRHGFVINLPRQDQLDATYYVGTRSGSNEKNKIEKAGFNTQEAEKVAPPRLEGCAAWIECKMHDALLEGDHFLIVGKPVSVEVPDEYWEGKFLAQEAEVFHHLGGSQFLCNGEVLDVELE